MSIEIKVEPYISVGKCVFGMTRNELAKMLGEPISTNNYGYPSSDGFIDDYNFFYLLSDKNEVFEAVEIFPIYTDELIILIYDNKKIELSTDLEKTLMKFAKIIDDMIQDEDGYSSVKLGMGLFCPDGQVENAIFYKQHYYD
jgi:hypothetical protein